MCRKCTIFGKALKSITDYKALSAASARERADTAAAGGDAAAECENCAPRYSHSHRKAAEVPTPVSTVPRARLLCFLLLLRAGQSAVHGRDD